jgi:hypothetical protein
MRGASWPRRRCIRMSAVDRQGGADLAGQWDSDPEGLMSRSPLTVLTWASRHGTAPQRPDT